MLTLPFVTSPVWAGLAARGLAAWFMPRIWVLFGILIGLCVGLLAWFITAGVIVLVEYNDLSIPWPNNSWEAPWPHPIWFTLPVGSAAITVGICWWAHRRF